jgi:hypothetical protein
LIPIFVPHQFAALHADVFAPIVSDQNVVSRIANGAAASVKEYQSPMISGEPPICLLRFSFSFELFVFSDPRVTLGLAWEGR